MRRYLINLLIAADQGWNAALGGDPDETISSRVGRGSLAGSRLAQAAERIINALFFHLTGERDHCRAKIETEC